MSDQPRIDRAVFAELQDSAGADFVAELVGTFAEETPGLLAELRHAQAAGLADRFRRAAHSIKSNSSTFGVRQLAELARALELGGLPAGTGPLDELEAEFRHALAALQAVAREDGGG